MSLGFAPAPPDSDLDAFKDLSSAKREVTVRSSVVEGAGVSADGMVGSALRFLREPMTSGWEKG